jgi:hypothetical protein
VSALAAAAAELGAVTGAVHTAGLSPAQAPVDAIDVRHVDVPEVAKVERHRQSGQATGTNRLRSGCGVLPRTQLLPFVLFFVLIPGQYAQSLNIESGRLTTAAFIGNANGSKAVTLAFSLPTIGLRVGVLTGLAAGQGELSEGLRRWQQHKLSLRRSPPTRPSPTSGVHRRRAPPPRFEARVTVG